MQNARIASRVTKWVPTTDLMMLRRMGKTSEECSELIAVAARCIILFCDAPRREE